MKKNSKINLIFHIHQKNIHQIVIHSFIYRNSILSLLVTRPNLGCRELVKRNLIRILPAIRNDLTDWVVAGRIKAAQLLAILTWQGEESITQHLEDTLQVCAKALVDDETVVREQVHQALIYIGYFVPIKTSFHLIRKHFEQTTSLGLLRLLAPILTGVDGDELIQTEKILDQILSIILKSEYTDNFQVNKSFKTEKKFSISFLSYQFKVNYYVSVNF